MPFKIVQTIEQGEICLTVVPARWEQNGVLLWPKKSAVAKLSQEENSVPAANWERIDCVMKRVFDTHSAAEQELRKMEAVSDTEADENQTHPPPPAKKPRLQQTQNVRDASVMKDFNRFIQHPENDLQDEEVSNDETSNPSSVPVPEAVLYLAEEEGVVDESSFVFMPQIPNAVNEDQIGNVLNTILVNLANIADNQTKMMQCMATLQTSMEYIAQAVFDDKSSGAPSAKRSDVLSKPVNTVEELNKLEESLKDEALFHDVVSNMSFICGSNGKSNGVDCSYKLIDYFMTRELLTECSWTGNSRGADENQSDNVQGSESSSKIPLKFYKNFRALFLKLVLLADKDFTEVNCEEFFKRVMKNSKQRLGVKATSKHKNRPKNLKYGTHKDDSKTDGDGGDGSNQMASSNNA